MLSSLVKQLVEEYFLQLRPGMIPKEVPRLHVDEIASRLAAFYERIRNVVDYREEHLLRKRFIDRVLRRRLVLNANGDIAEAIIKEIIRAGHLPNDAIPETKIPEIQRILANYEELLRHLTHLSAGKQDAISQWLYTLAARAIEENLFPPRRDEMLSKLMYITIRPHLTVRGSALREEDINAQLFISIQRALLKVDEDQLHYRLLKFIYPHWGRMKPEEYGPVAAKLPEIKANIEAMAHSRLAPAFFKFANRYDTVFYIVGDVVDGLGGIEELEAALAQGDELEHEIRRAYDRRFKREKTRLGRLAFLSVLSFFISKIAVALAVEIPLEKFLADGVSWLHTTVNVLFPPFLMLVIVSAIRMPRASNFGLVRSEVNNVLTEDAERKYLIDIPKKKGALTETTVRFFYLLVFVGVLYFVTKLLFMLQFNIANIAIFVFFVSMVAATGVRIHNRSKELSLEAHEVRFMSFIFDLLAMPFITIGKWILGVLSKFNPIVILANLIIEVPFQILVEFLENFRGFIKSKKEEIT